MHFIAWGAGVLQSCKRLVLLLQCSIRGCAGLLYLLGFSKKREKKVGSKAVVIVLYGCAHKVVWVFIFLLSVCFKCSRSSSLRVKWERTNERTGRQNWH